jgi:prepilin-type N-terminal cleavage/methylation domain-containing protein
VPRASDMMNRASTTSGRAPASRGGARGFTLIETSMALIIIGVGVLAFVDAQQGFTRNNNWSSQAATATLLANEVRELTRHCTRHDPVTGIWIETTGGAPVVRGWGPESGETTADSFDDLDDFDGRVFGATGDMDGPVNAFGEVVPSIDLEGNVVRDEQENIIPLQGWTQSVRVEKVDPFDWTLVRANGYEQTANGSFAGRAVDKFPLRITVTVSYQSPLDPSPSEITRLVWVVPN